VDAERTGDAAGAMPPDVVRTLVVTSRIVERALTDMSLPQLRVMLLVSNAPERANHLATKAAVSRPSLTGVLDGLEARGWIRRQEVDGDRRGVSLVVTDDGRRALDAPRVAADGRLEQVLDRVPPDRRAAALDGLAALGTAIQADLAERRAARDAAR
jgi:DNA-binding MarR family transcriptional regulator